MEREKRKSQVTPLEEKVVHFSTLNHFNLFIKKHLFFPYYKINNSNKIYFLKTRTKADTKPDQSKVGNKKEQQKSQAASQKANKKSNTPKSNSTTTKQVDNSKTKSNAKSKQTAQSNSGEDGVRRNHGNEKRDATVVKERSLAEDLKTDAGAASDESWEKDFDLSDQ